MNFRIDSEKLNFHPKRVVEWLEKKECWETAKEIYPIYVEVAPTGACNHRCTFCAVDYIGYKSVNLEAALFADRVHEMSGLGVKSVMFAGEGEPLLNKQIDSMVNASVYSGVDVSFTTNGVLLNKLETLPSCEWVKVSVNAGTSESYSKIHRTKEKDWSTVWKNIKDAAERKGSCTLGVQMVLLPENVNEVQELYDRCDEAGVDYLVVKPYSQHKFSIIRRNEMPPVPVVETRKTQFIFRDESYETRKIGYDKCQATPYLWAYVMATGEVYSCSAYLLDPRFRLGNINEKTFKEIWQGEERKKNWSFVRETLDIHECRLNCRMDKVNIYLTDLVKGVPHENFI